MAKQRTTTSKSASKTTTRSTQPRSQGKAFHVEFLNQAQKMAWNAFEQHDVLFLLGPAGCGKTHLACAFALSEVLAKRKERIFMTRPILEAGESLGFLPGELADKVDPYMRPMQDCVDKCIGVDSPTRERIDRVTEVAPLAYMRGRTFDDAVCIFDEAQNATYKHLKLFLTRFGQNSKIIITGDPRQSDLPGDQVPLVEVVQRLENLQGIGVVRFKHSSIVRHPLVASIIEQLEREEE
jgi:phosphate starvation-inducible PhoH-like protein